MSLLGPAADYMGQRPCGGAPKITPDTTLRELLSYAQETACFDTLYLALACLERGQQIVVNGVNVTGYETRHIDLLRLAGVDTANFSPPWLARVRELLDTIAKENGYEPPSNRNPDEARNGAGHEDED